MFSTVGLLLVLYGCAETSTQRMINADYHNGLATLAEGAGATAQDADVDQPDREHVLLGAAQ
jgi:hypothetical protein